MESKPADSQGPFPTIVRLPVGPCAHVDPEIVKLLADATAVLYGAIEAARHLPDPKDEAKTKWRKILIATAALGASEAESAMALASVDLLSTTRIHVRALGDDARRANVLFRNVDIAVSLYDSLDATRKHLGSKITAGHEVRLMVDEFFKDIDGQRMEKIEQSLAAKFAADDEAAHIMTPYERALWSKWAHGDVIAMAEVVSRLNVTAADLRTAINVDDDGDLALHRAVGFALTILIALIGMGIDAQSDVVALGKRLADYREKVRPRFEAGRRRKNEIVQHLKAQSSARRS